jgi:ATP-dependent DNA helicase RecQ
MNQAIDINQLVDEDRQQSIIAAIEVVGDSSLTQIYQLLREKYNYDEIKLVRAWWRKNRGKKG